MRVFVDDREVTGAFDVSVRQGWVRAYKLTGLIPDDQKHPSLRGLPVLGVERDASGKPVVVEYRGRVRVERPSPPDAV